MVDMVSGEKHYPSASKMRNTANEDDIRSCGSHGYMYEEDVVENRSEVPLDGKNDDFNKFLTIAFIILIILL
jgi:hypothetical protein